LEVLLLLYDRGLPFFYKPNLFWGKYFLCLKLFYVYYKVNLSQKNIFQLTILKFVKKGKFQKFKHLYLLV